MKEFKFWNSGGKRVTKILSLSSTLLLLVALTSCRKTHDNNPPSRGYTSPAMVLAWNDLATQAFIHFPDQPAPPPMIESRIYAMVNVAMHDALNNVKKKYATYALESM